MTTQNQQQTQIAKQQDKFPIKTLFESPNVKQKLQELLNKNAATFTTSVLQIVNSNSMLRNAEPMSVFNAACMAATLNLPLQNGLGFAYIVPYQNKKERLIINIMTPFPRPVRGFFRRNLLCQPLCNLP